MLICRRGTGDIQLTISQKVPVSGAVIVTTPQDIALLDARKGIEMFRKVDIPVLGVVENMSVHICSNCGHSEAIFGSGGGEELSNTYGAPLVGQLPLKLAIREAVDSGKPTLVADPQGTESGIYRSIARQLAETLKKAAGGRSCNAEYFYQSGLESSFIFSLVLFVRSCIFFCKNAAFYWQKKLLCATAKNNIKLELKRWVSNQTAGFAVLQLKRA